MNLEEHADSGRAQKAAVAEIEGERMMPTAQLLVHDPGEFPRMLRIEPA